MDLRRLAIVSLILAGCGISPDVHYQRGRLLLKQGKQKEAMVEAEAGWRAEPSWRFRILKADILLVLGESKAAADLLAFPEPPSDPESRVRLWMFNIHLYTGLALSVLTTIIGVTGSIIDISGGRVTQ